MLVRDIIADLVGPDEDSPSDSPRIRPDSPPIRPGETRVVTGFSPDSPLSPPKQCENAVRLWLIRDSDGHLFSSSFTPPATRSEVEGFYPDAQSIRPETAEEEREYRAMAT